MGVQQPVRYFSYVTLWNVLFFVTVYHLVVAPLLADWQHVAGQIFGFFAHTVLLIVATILYGFLSVHLWHTMKLTNGWKISLYSISLLVVYLGHLYFR